MPGALHFVYEVVDRAITCNEVMRTDLGSSVRQRDQSALRLRVAGMVQYHEAR